MLRCLLVGFVLLLFVVAGCGKAPDGEEAPVASTPLDSAAQSADLPIQGPTDDSDQYYPEGNFKIAWPPGCEKVRVRRYPDPETDDPDDLIMAHLFCDHPERANEGCAVTVHFDMKDDFGGQATPQQVIAMVEDLIAQFKVQIVQQHQIRRTGIEGIMAHCREPGSTGSVWIEGFLLDDTSYIVSAWKPEGELFLDADYRFFFASFEVKQ